MKEIQEEIWKGIENYEGLYQISSHGRVKSLKRTVLKSGNPFSVKESILRQCIGTTGYYHASLSKNCKGRTFKTHRMVANTFIPKEDGKVYINHKDGNPLNNYYENLEWCTAQENSKHSIYELNHFNVDRGFVKADSVRPVKQICKRSGNVLCKYRTVMEASRTSKVSHSAISRILKGTTKNGRHFYWEYDD